MNGDGELIAGQFGQDREGRSGRAGQFGDWGPASRLDRFGGGVTTWLARLLRCPAAWWPTATLRYDHRIDRCGLGFAHQLAGRFIFRKQGGCSLVEIKIVVHGQGK